MTRDLDFARQCATVAAARYAEFTVEYGPDHPRTRQARESRNGWRQEVQRLERLADQQQAEGFNGLVDRLMAKGYDRAEAEHRAEQIEPDNA